MSELEPTTSSSEITSQGIEETEKQDDFAEPEVKKRKISSNKPEEKIYNLVERLGGILCCAVCLDLPRNAIYQVRKFSLIHFFSIITINLVHQIIYYVTIRVISLCFDVRNNSAGEY